MVHDRNPLETEADRRRRVDEEQRKKELLEADFLADYMRNYGPDLDKITDAKDRADTTTAMVKRIDEYYRRHDVIFGKEFGPRIRELANLHRYIVQTDPQRAVVEKELAAINTEWDKLLAPHSKALHEDLDNIVKNAIEPYVKDVPKDHDERNTGKDTPEQAWARFQDRQREQGREQDHGIYRGRERE